MENQYKLFFEEDEVIFNSVEGNTRWVATLSDGRKVYQDDFREYEFDDERRYSTWVRLRDFCKKEKIDVVGILLQFRTNKIALEQNAEGYYFCKSVLGAFGMDRNIHFFVTGHVRDGKIHVKKWQVPELIVESEEVREIRENDLCLILRNDYVTSKSEER